MDDIISREMAIDAVVDRLKKMPSVQSKTSPKISDILDYLDTILHPIISPEYYAVYVTLYDMISLLDLEQEAVISVPSTQQWIPVRERLPEINKPVLVWVYDEYYLSELHSIDGVLHWDFDQFDLSGDEFDDVVAWMPLPKPYNSDLK